MTDDNWAKEVIQQVREELPHLHRSFPEAGDGRPLPPMGDELMTAGLSAEDARFVAVQLRKNGYYLVNPDNLGWPDIHRFQDALRGGLTASAADARRTTAVCRLKDSRT